MAKIAGAIFHRDNRTVVFVSEKSLTELIDPQAAENVIYTISVIGTDAGNGAVTDFNSEPLDGDNDNTPGGDFLKELAIIG